MITASEMKTPKLVTAIKRMAAAIGGFVDAHFCGAFLRAYGAGANRHVGEGVVAEIGLEELSILRFRFDGNDSSGGTGEFAEKAGKVANVGADVEEIAARRI